MTEIAAQQEERRRKAFQRGKTWIIYPFGEAVVGMCKELLGTPRCHRMPCLLLIGETNCGKTMTMHQVEKKFSHKKDVTVLYGASPSTIPVVYVQTPNSADESRFYNQILSAIGAPTRPSAQAKQLQSHTINLLQVIGCRMLIIDEVHNLLLSGAQKLRQAQAMIRFLTNELQIPIVAVGIRDALNVFAADPQLANRFKPVMFPRWQNDESLAALLLGFESRYPDWTGVLTQPSISARILALSEGLLGEIIDLLMLLRSRVDRSGVPLCDDTFEQCGYVSPSLRSRVAGF